MTCSVSTPQYFERCFVTTSWPLPIYSDAVLPGPVTCRLLQAIPWWDEQVRQGLCGIEHRQLAPGSALRWSVQPPRSLSVPGAGPACQGAGALSVI
jgi:hypothetical protein